MKVLAGFLAMLCCGMLQLCGGEPIPLGELVRIRSKVLGEERLLAISTPLNYATSSEAYPVLYLTDGADHLLHTRGTVDFLVRNGLMPELIIVGILNTERTRDLTPTHASAVNGDGSRVDIPTSGGAPKFLEFFQQELFPHIETTYRTLPYRIFAGHSLGGLLALHTLAVQPDCFNALIAASPSLEWDEEYPLRTLRDFFKDRKDLKRTLYVTMADEEAREPRPNRFDRLRGLLSRVKAQGFAWDSKSLPEESHGSVVLLSYYWGLRKIFAGWQLPVDPSTGQYGSSLKDLQQHYQKVADRLGYAFTPPELVVNLVGYQALGRKALPEAVAIFRFNVQQHPGSANVHDSLGEALERSDLEAEALTCYQKAVQLGQTARSPFLPTFNRNYERVARKLKAP